jgi:F-type H+-transporting ATPase subunit delta
MTNRAAAARYARALFDVVRKSADHGDAIDPVQAGADLDAFIALVSSHPELHRVLLSPGIPAAAKINIIADLLDLRPPAMPVGRLLVMLAERDRLVLLPDLAAVYHERVLEFQKVVKADVTTAIPLAPEKADALRRSLSLATGKQVLLQTGVDPSILGGVVARVGGVVFDGSVARHLARMRAQLVEAGQ